MEKKIFPQSKDHLFSAGGKFRHFFQHTALQLNGSFFCITVLQRGIKNGTDKFLTVTVACQSRIKGSHPFPYGNKQDFPGFRRRIFPIKNFFREEKKTSGNAENNKEKKTDFFRHKKTSAFHGGKNRPEYKKEKDKDGNSGNHTSGNK